MFHAGKLLPESTITQTVTQVLTDEGAEGYYFGGSGHGDMDGMSPEQRAISKVRLKNLVVGQDPSTGRNSGTGCGRPIGFQKT